LIEDVEDLILMFFRKGGKQGGEVKLCRVEYLPHHEGEYFIDCILLHANGIIITFYFFFSFIF
jgi:hypothetical protein